MTLSFSGPTPFYASPSRRVSCAHPPARIRARKLKVAVDGCASVGGFAVLGLLRGLGAPAGV